MLGLALLLGIGGAAYLVVVRTTDEDRYVADLTKSKLLSGLGTEDAAIAQGKAFCLKLEGGAKPRGYRSQQIAVRDLCPQFSSHFLVVPTPQEQQEHLTKALRDRGLGGRFPSDAAAVAHAKSVCRALDDGGPQQGPEEDEVAVSVYCDKYDSGFETLYPIKVKGSFMLMESDPSSYFPSISGTAHSCAGDGGYADIGPGTEVVVKNDSGQVLTTTQLGRGTGIPPVMCEFKFAFTVMDGSEGGYSVSVSHRGETHYTAAELKMPHAVELTLGD